MCPRTDRAFSRMLPIAGLIVHTTERVLVCPPGLQPKATKGETTMSFGIYIVGYIILIIGLAIGANMLHIPPKWIGVGVICLIGIAILHGVTATRQKDAAS